jgi:hypothetical protein
MAKAAGAVIVTVAAETHELASLTLICRYPARAEQIKLVRCSVVFEYV